MASRGRRKSHSKNGKKREKQKIPTFSFVTMGCGGSPSMPTTLSIWGRGGQKYSQTQRISLMKDLKNSGKILILKKTHSSSYLKQDLDGKARKFL